MKQQIQFGSKRIYFSLSFAERKSMTIKVHPNEIIEVIAPLGSDKKKILLKKN